MSWANALSLDDIRDLYSERHGFDRKTKAAYLELSLQLRMRGSLPMIERYLAGIAEVTLRCWNEKVWPLIRDLFVVEDGRLYHAEIERAERRPRPEPARWVPPEVAEAKRRAGIVSGLTRRQRALDLSGGEQKAEHNEQNDEHNRTQCSTESTAGVRDCVQPVQPVRAGAPSLSEAYLPESDENHPFREREGAREASEHNEQPVQQNREQKAEQKGRRMERPAPPERLGLLPVPDDWKPNEEALARLMADGHNPAIVAEKFRSDCRAKARRFADPDAAFMVFCLNERPPTREMTLLRKVEGGKPADASTGGLDPARERIVWAKTIAMLGKLGPFPTDAADAPRVIAWIDALLAWRAAGHPKDRKPPCFADFQPAAAKLREAG